MRQFEIRERHLAQLDGDSGEVVLATAPDAHERALLQEQLRLDDYDLASTLDPDEVPRLESSNGRLFLIWKVPETAAVAETVELRVGVVGISLYRERVAFIRASGDIPITDREFRSVSDARDVMLAFLLRTIRHFVVHLRAIRQISGELEKKITVSMENKHLLQMFSLSESLVYYVDALEGNGAVLTKLRDIAADDADREGAPDHSSPFTPEGRARRQRRGTRGVRRVG